MPELSTFDRAMARLGEAFWHLHSDHAARDPRFAAIFRHSVVHTFEDTYDVAIKTLRRFVNSTKAAPDAIDRLSFQEAIQLGIERGLIRSSLAVWADFRVDSCALVRAGRTRKAEQILHAIPAFLAEARSLHDAIYMHHAAHAPSRSSQSVRMSGRAAGRAISAGLDRGE